MMWLSVVSAALLTVALVRWLWSPAGPEDRYTRSRLGMKPVGAIQELPFIYGSGTPSLGDPPPAGPLEPEAHTIHIDADGEPL